MSVLPWNGHFRFFTPLRCVQNDSGGVARSLFSQQSLMSVATDTTWNESRGRATTRVAPTTGLPAAILRGMTVWWLRGRYFRSNRSCRLSPTPPGMKGALVPPFFEGLMARHRGWIPASAGMTAAGLRGRYFRSNRSCRLSPTPSVMKMAVGTIRKSREVGRGLFWDDDGREWPPTARTWRRGARCRPSRRPLPRRRGRRWLWSGA